MAMLDNARSLVSGKSFHLHVYQSTTIIRNFRVGDRYGGYSCIHELHKYLGRNGNLLYPYFLGIFLTSLEFRIIQKFSQKQRL